MAIKEPNRSSDYHINTENRWSYQLQEASILHIIDGMTASILSMFREILINKEEAFILPNGVPISQ
jgi:hypothetical protein